MRQRAARAALLCVWLAVWACSEPVSASRHALLTETRGRQQDTATAPANTFLPAFVLLDAGSSVVLQNGFARASFNLTRPQLDVLQGDFTGCGVSGANVLVGDGNADPFNLGRAGLVLERVNSIQQLWTTQAASSAAAPPTPLGVQVVSNTSELARVVITGVVDNARDPRFTSTWDLSLGASSRKLLINVTITSTAASTVTAVRLSLYTRLAATYGQFDRGVVAVVGSTPAPYFGTNSTPRRAYFTGHGPAGGVGAGSVDVTASGAVNQTILLSSTPPVHFFHSGVQLAAVGWMADTDMDVWAPDWRFADNHAVTKGQTWQVGITLAPSQLNAPVGDEPTYAPGDCTVAESGSVDAGSAPAPIPVDDSSSLLEGGYCAAAGGLLTYDMPGRISSTILHPVRTSYKHEYTFYDPDTFLSIAAMCYTGDAYLMGQALSLIETSMDAMRPSGQIPHNFVNNTPVFSAISGANQTGPNMFWSSAALLYARESGDYDWLKANVHHVSAAVGFLTAMYEPSHQLLFVPGPLWIDTLIRTNYSTDSNVFMVRLLQEFSDALQLLARDPRGTLGDGAGTHTGVTQAELFRMAGQASDMATNITQGINTHLWSAEDDHYVTQLNPDGSIRDFVDYDSNLLAIAIGVAPPDRASRIFKRVDAGVCTHVRPTYVSEKFYGPSDVYAGNIGDSVVAMGRIAWADGLARAAAGDATALQSLVLGPLQAATLRDTWMFERFVCEPNAGVWGQPAHSNFFIEFGEVVAMLLREAKYGIYNGFTGARIAPLQGLAPESFTYHVGQVFVAYDQARTCISLPGATTKRVVVAGMVPNGTYTRVASSSAASANASRRAWSTPANVSHPHVARVEHARPTQLSVVRASASGELAFQAALGGSKQVCVQLVTRLAGR